MSTSINTKYRPNTWDEVIGQGAVVDSLANAIAKKLGTAFLLTGPSGTGKTTLARIASTQLGCKPDDLLDFDAATKTGIEDIREVIDTLLYRPLGDGAIKVVIIDEAHALSKQAVTALLKSLEDPPSWVYWFLCTSEPTKIPVAIKRRCLAYQLKEVSTNTIIDLLDNTEEGHEIDEAILELCAREARGSPGQALANLGVCLVAKSKAEAAELLRSAEESPAAFELAKALIKGASWSQLRGLLSDLKETSPESVRHVVRGYMTTVILNAKSDRDANNALDVLQAFSQPFNSFDGISPLLLACGLLSRD